MLRQIDYDYQRMQYNTVVSGAMKLLNALEGFKSDGSPGDRRRACARASASCCAASTRPRRTSRTRCGSSSATTSARRRCSTRPGREVDTAALEQDEIELMLQVNGKLRGSLRVPAGATKQEIEKIALASEAFAKHAEGATAKRVIVVPGRLVNVVI